MYLRKYQGKRIPFHALISLIWFPFFLNHIRNLRKYKLTVAPSMSLYPLSGKNNENKIGQKK